MKRSLSILLIFALLLCGSFPIFSANTTQKGAAYPQDVSARSAILIDAHEGNVLYEKEAHVRLGMASTTKLMTALVALKLCDANRLLTVPEEAVGIEGSSVYLTEGERLTLSDLLKALLLASANDAAVAIALTLSGSIEAFAEEMNDYATELGLTDTHFTNPHGLYDPDHYTTAAELASIATEVLKNDTLSAIVSEKKATIPMMGEKDKRLLVNHNKLLDRYSGAIGMKTGYTKATGRCLVSAAEREGLTLIAVTLNAPDDWNDHARLLDYGFENYCRMTFYAEGSFSYALPLSDSEHGSVSLTNTDALTLTVRRGHSEPYVTVELPFRFAVGEVKKGEKHGRVILTVDGRSVASLLEYSENIKGKTKNQKGFFERILGFFP